jgi:hypothetical protein
MDDRDHAEMRALCDQFRQLMARQVDELPLFDQEAFPRLWVLASLVDDGH